MFDIHYHLLFGLDDGPKTIEDSLKLGEASIAEGVTHIVCTPHANERFPFHPERNREKLALLNEHLGGRVTLGLGCDFHLSHENIEELKSNRTKYTINGTKYLLAELSDFGVPHSLSKTLDHLTRMGIVPIITHPERNPTLVADPSRIAEWIGFGCLIQITAGSLLGRFGKRAESMSHHLLKHGRVHFVASDAHSIDGRPPSMAPAHDVLKRRYGRETADRLCLHNPRAAFLGEALPDAASNSQGGKSRKGGLLDWVLRR